MERCSSKQGTYLESVVHVAGMMEAIARVPQGYSANIKNGAGHIDYDRLRVITGNVTISFGSTAAQETA